MSKKKITNSSKIDVSKQAKASEQVEKYSQLQIVWHFRMFDVEFTKKLIGNDTDFLTIEAFANKVKSVEQADWNSLISATHGNKGKSSSHNIPINEIDKQAQKRLTQLNMNDIDSIYSLRFDGGTFRLWGKRTSNIFNIIWIDPHHKVCPSKR